MLHCNTPFIYVVYRPQLLEIMSKQLALSSAFATFAMAAMVLLHTPDQSGTGADNGVFEHALELGAELPSTDVPGPSLLPV